MGAGEIYAQAGDFLNPLVAAMGEYHKRHVAYDQQMSMAQAFGNIGYTPDGQLTSIDAAKESGQKVKPIIDPKFLEQFTAKTASQRDKNIGGLEAYNRIAQSVVQHQIALAAHNQSPQGQMQQKALDTPFFTMPDPVTGQPVMGRNTPSGAVLGTTGGQTPYQQAVQNRFQINQAIKARKELAKEFNEGFTPEDYLGTPIPGVQDKSGKYVPVDPASGVQPTVFGLQQSGDKSPSWFPAAEFAKKQAAAKQYQDLGKLAFSGLSGGTQDAPVMVRTPAEARALPPGTLVQTPDGRIGRTKGAPAAAVEEETADEDASETEEE